MKVLMAFLFSVLCLSAWGADRGGHDDHDRGGDRGGHDGDRGHDRDFHEYGYRPFVSVYPVRPIYPTGQYFISGYYETKTEIVLVEPERVEKQYVPPVYETKYENGKPVVVMIVEGYYRDVVIPAKYETREVRIWVPGYWSSLPYRVETPVVVEPRTGVDVDFFIGQRGRHTSWGLGLGIRE